MVSIRGTDPHRATIEEVDAAAVTIAQAFRGDLESTNPRNDNLNTRLGYVAFGAFEAVRDRAILTTMRRPMGD